MSTKLTAIYDLIESRSYAQALKLCDQWLKKKNPDDDVVKAIRAMCFVQLDRRKDALAQCDELSGSRDATVLQTLQQVFTKLRCPERMICIFEEASKEGMNEIILRYYYFALLRVGDWAKMQQVALKLFAQYTQQRYLEWAIMCMLLQGGRIRDFAHKMLVKLGPKEEPERGYEITGGRSEAPMKAYCERCLLEAACWEAEPLKAIEALEATTWIDSFLVGRRRRMCASLYCDAGNPAKALEILQPIDSFEVAQLALECGCELDVDQLPLQIRIRVYAWRKDPHAVCHYLQEFGNQADAFFHIRPFLGDHCEHPSLDGSGWKLVNAVRTRYALGCRDDILALISQETDEGCKDVLRLFAAVDLAEKADYRTAIELLDQQSPAEVEARRSATLQFLLYGWSGNSVALVELFDKLELKNVLFSTRFVALAIQWLLEKKELTALERIAKMARHFGEETKDIDDAMEQIMDRGPLDRLPELFAFKRDQLCSLAHANADTALAIVHLHENPDDLESLDFLSSLDHDVHDTDSGSLLHEICTPTGIMPSRRSDALFSVPPPHQAFDQCSVHFLMRPDLVHSVRRRKQELWFLRQLHRGSSELTNVTERHSFDAATAIVREDYDTATTLIAGICTVREEEWEASLSETIDIAVLCWAAKFLPKSKKRQSPLFAARTSLRAALLRIDVDARPSMKEIVNFRP